MMTLISHEYIIGKTLDFCKEGSQISQNHFYISSPPPFQWKDENHIFIEK